MFIVVQVQQDFDYVEGVEFIAKFDKIAEAYEFIQVNKESSYKQYLKREKYISGYVDAINLPEGLDYYGKKQYLENSLPFNFICISWDNIKQELKRNLINTRILPKVTDAFKDYNPPNFPLNWDNTFVLEIP
jgi:hypothetical protein